MSGSSPGINIITTSTSKRRKVVEKSVVTFRVGAATSAEKQKSGGPPSDPWSWRKYGHKPIKGSPYPRGYYRCSTSKGCSAKKQVERCKTDATLLIITYTSDHNHPSLSLPSVIASSPLPQSHCTEEEEEEEEEKEDCSSPNDEKPSTSTAREKKGLNDDHSSKITELELVGKTSTDLITPSSSSSCGKSDFFDELEDLPTSSSLATALQIGNFFDERVLLPSQSMPSPLKACQWM